jgi:Uma2 family endonuclease
MSSVKKIHTLKSFLNHFHAEHSELINGEIVQKSHPGGEHAQLQAAAVSHIYSKFHGKPKEDGTGGRWILSEVSVYYPKFESILQPDIAGWRRDAHPEKPTGYPVRTIPNWVCEICHTTQKKDTTVVPQTLAAHNVEFYWIVYVESKNLQVFKLMNDKYSLMGSYFIEDKLQRIMPFESLELNVTVLLGEDD